MQDNCPLCTAPIIQTKEEKEPPSHDEDHDDVQEPPEADPDAEGFVPQDNGLEDRGTTSERDHRGEAVGGHHSGTGPADDVNNKGLAQANVGPSNDAGHEDNGWLNLVPGHGDDDSAFTSEVRKRRGPNLVAGD